MDQCEGICRREEDRFEANGLLGMDFRIGSNSPPHSTLYLIQVRTEDTGR